MASDSEPESGTADQAQAALPKAVPSDRPKKKKAKRPRAPLPRTEEEIDSPTKMTVGMLGILGIMTIIMWAFARGACNYHPPKETRVPRKETTADLAHDPKNAAIELQQRWLTHDFDGALELATGNAAELVKQDKAACDAACLGKHAALDKVVLTSAVMVDVNPLGATARVSSVNLPDGPKTYLMRMQREDTIWKAVDRLPDAPVVPSTIESAAPASSGSALPAVSDTSSASAAPVVSAAPVASGAKLHHAPPASSTTH